MDRMHKICLHRAPCCRMLHFWWLTLWLWPSRCLQWDTEQTVATLETLSIQTFSQFCNLFLFPSFSWFLSSLSFSLSLSLSLSLSPSLSFSLTMPALHLLSLCRSHSPSHLPPSLSINLTPSLSMLVSCSVLQPWLRDHTLVAPLKAWAPNSYLRRKRRRQRAASRQTTLQLLHLFSRLESNKRVQLCLPPSNMQLLCWGEQRCEL